MNLPDLLLGEAWYWTAWAVWGLLFAHFVLKAPWRLFRDSELFNVWLGMVVFLTLIWSLKAGVRPGLSLHLLGSAVLNLCFGPYLAFIGVNAILAGVTLNGMGGWEGFALNALLLGGVGIGISNLVLRFVESCLPHHFFVYIFANGFFGAALSVIGTGIMASLVLVISQTYSAEYLLGEYLPYFLLLGFSEAWLSGMVMTLFVVYRPTWVQSFDDASYLANK